MAFNPYSYRTRVYPTLRDFYNLCDKADSPNIKNRDIVSFFRTIRRPLVINTKLKGVVGTRKAALECFDWEIVVEDANKFDACTITTRTKREINKLIARQLDHVLYGKFLAELLVVTDMSGGKTQQLVKVNRILQPWKFDVLDDKLYLIEQNILTPTSLGYKVTEVTDQTNYLLTYEDEEEPGGLLRGIIIDEIMRYDMLLENANYLRKLKGILQIVNKGGSDEDQAAAESAAQTVIRDNYVVTSDSIEFKLNEIAKAGSAGFETFSKSIQDEITIAVLGQANTTQLPHSGGSRAALQVQKMISADLFYSDMNRVETLINRYLLLDYRLNYDSNADESPYRFRFNLEQEEDVEKNAIAIREILNSGITLIIEEIYKKLGFSVPSKGDRTLGGSFVATSSV
jgi:hypothetical protein